MYSLHLYDQKTSYFDHKGSFEKQQCFSFRFFNEIYRVSVYERHNENSLIPPSEKPLLLFLSYWRDLLASVYERSNTAFAFKKT